ncbi:DNA-binding transcriptional regulator, XRE-family HTH domain [Jeotgalicoccus aerolatus]|uniref:DNA-binding transcriptional regulator, XRE-family HTH domain n=2 Tax=Staphylococcaceae TaxID=90964 RepID=A0A1G9EPH2_9STAP|nr:helix-turn-helix transcriptional regulator [Jeotgalicoccus aerolatus]SDK77941.1 DNA-binding transcriptional regulator, XRE-family HTH domain [Jeotgalicoccus aerolatus]
MDFHKILKKKRIEDHLSQEELAEQLNISRQSISKWENEKGYPNIETLLKISEIFNVTVDELLKGDDYLKNKIIQDSKKLKYPKWKSFFDILTFIGLIFIIAKIIIFIITKITGNEITFLSGSIVYSFLPLLLMIIGAIGTDILRKKYK